MSEWTLPPPPSNGTATCIECWAPCPDDPSCHNGEVIHPDRPRERLYSCQKCRSKWGDNPIIVEQP